MRIVVLSLLAAVTSGCAMPCGTGSGCSAPLTPALVAAAQSPQRISFVHRSWGAIIERWTLDGNSVVWEKPEKPGFTGGPVEVAIKRFTLSSEQRAAVEGRFADVLAAKDLPDECTYYIPDGPYGTVGWTVAGEEREMKFTASCLEGPNAEKSGAAFKMSEIIVAAADQVPVSETKVAE